MPPIALLCLASHQLVDDIQRYRGICVQYGQNSTDMILSHQEHLCHNLMGRAPDPLTLSGEVINEADTMRALDGRHPYSLRWLLLIKHLLAVYFNQHPEARNIAARFRAMGDGGILEASAVSHTFLEGLTAAVLSKTDRNELRRAQKVCKELRSYQRISSENFTNKVCLVEAEMAAATSDIHVAMTKYQESLDAAHKKGFLHEEALANE